MLPQDKHTQKKIQERGIWSEIPDNLWSNWTWQMRNRATTREALEKFLPLTQSEKTGFEGACKRLSFAITPYFLSLINPMDDKDPIRLQVIPRAEETIVGADESTDPIDEERFSPVPGIVHRYPDRVLLLTTDRCACYCRYCTRSRLVSGNNARDITSSPTLTCALDYIRKHTEVRDVLISGGDCLLLSDRKLDDLLTRIRAIPHVEFIRLGSRVPVFLPQRITPSLCSVLKKHGGIWLSMHINHPNECTQDLKLALEKLAFSGVVLGSQSVLLKGINDSTETIKSLIHKLLTMRVRPYYLYSCDKIIGSAHFRVPIEKGCEIIRSLRGYTTGYAIPQFVEDTPNKGKIIHQ